ncbi:MAG: type II secretion system protein [Clostridia bacterium]|nr:type II secretion system protein [Clostridia bacterium]
MKKNKGFSLVELIVVIAIMAILAAVAIPTFSMFIRKAQEASDLAYMRGVERIIKLAYADYPDVKIDHVYVYVDPETNKAVWIEYELDIEVYADEVRNPNVEHEVEEEDQDQGDDNRDDIIVESIDWDYQFKAFDLNEDNQKWAEDHWQFFINDNTNNDYAGNDDADTPGSGTNAGDNDLIIDDEEGNAVGGGNNDENGNGDSFDWIIGDDLAGP